MRLSTRASEVTPNKALQRTAATVDGLPGREVPAVTAAAELGRSARETFRWAMC